MGAHGCLLWILVRLDGSTRREDETREIGTGVMYPTIRYHPGIVAQAFATLGTYVREVSSWASGLVRQ